MRANPGSDGLLPDIGVTRAMDEPALMAACQLLLALADSLHRTVELEEFILSHGEVSIQWSVVSGWLGTELV